MCIHQRSISGVELRTKRNSIVRLVECGPARRKSAHPLAALQLQKGRGCEVDEQAAPKAHFDYCVCLQEGGSNWSCSVDVFFAPVKRPTAVTCC